VADANSNRPGFERKIVYGTDEKWDIQLSQSAIAERGLGAILLTRKIGPNPVLIELKTERWLWRKHNRIAIEYWRNGKPSGISVTQADFWFQELRWANDAPTLCFILFPIDVLKDLTRKAIKNHHNAWGGDGRTSKIAFISLTDILTLYD
jgi:hypothetical protein